MVNQGILNILARLEAQHVERNRAIMRTQGELEIIRSREDDDEAETPGLSDHEPGSTSDLSLLLKRVQVHRRMLSKTAEDRRNQDQGEGCHEFPEYWAVLLDKGYQGSEGALRSIRPKKKPKGRPLDRLDEQRNKDVSSDRVIVENYFGRLCSLWEICHRTFPWSESKYNIVQRVTFALTNYHVSFMPLRSSDCDYYHSVLAKYEDMATFRVDASRQRAERYRRGQHCRAEVDRNQRRRTSISSQTSMTTSMTTSMGQGFLEEESMGY